MSDILVIDLNPRESECQACGEHLVQPRFGIPMYEGLVLPNETEGIDFGAIIRGWDGEWGGFDACEPCYRTQGRLTEVVTIDELLERRRRGL